MAKRLKTNPRKRPQQSRARETVDAILAATARLLSSTGYDTMSTNRVALAAGVSIGSLYQYFPSKEAIVAALIDRHGEELLLVFRRVLMDHMGGPPEVTVRAVVRAMVEAKAVNPRLNKALREQVPRVGKLNFVETMHEELIAVVARYLASREELRIEDPQLTAFFAVKTVDGLLQNIQEPMLKDRGPERIIDEIVNFLVAYFHRNRTSV